MPELTVGHFCYEMLLNLANDFTYTPSQNIQNFVVAWTHAEGGGVTNACSYNLLNTMQKEQGSVQCQGTIAGIQSYPDAATGLKAMVDALSNGNYNSLKHALATNDENNLGFNGHAMASNVAGDLSVWLSGSRTLTPSSQYYILSIMAMAGISNPKIVGQTVSRVEPVTSQSTINQWAGISLGGDASDVGPPGANAGGTKNPGQSSSLWTQNDVIKVASGVFLILIASVLFVKMQFPVSGIAKVLPFKVK